MIALLDKTARAHLREKGLPISQNISLAVDVAVSLALAAVGHFWLAGFWLWQQGCEQVIYDKRKDA